MTCRLALILPALLCLAANPVALIPFEWTADNRRSQDVDRYRVVVVCEDGSAAHEFWTAGEETVILIDQSLWSCTPYSVVIEAVYTDGHYSAPSEYSTTWQASPVPEPSWLAAGLIGLVLLNYWRKRTWQRR